MSNFKLALQPNWQAIDGIALAAGAADWKSLLVAVAYATTSGCQQLVGELESQWEGFVAAEKLFLVGLDFGLTEPGAIEYLGALSGSAVRLYEPVRTLKAQLRPAQRFHPKVYAVADGKSLRLATASAGIVGSTNLTGCGLTSNVEAFAAFHVSTSDAIGAAWVAELRSLERLALSMPAPTATLVSAYEKLRAQQPPLPRPDPEPPPGPFVPHQDLSPEMIRALRSARFFWTETLAIVQNLGRGRPGNQVDLKKGARAFFGSRIPLSAPVNTALAEIRLRGVEGEETYQLRYGHNGMDKVNLPAPQGRERYDHRFLLWERLEHARFELTVQTDGSSWRKASRREGALFKYTGNSREWGFFNSAASARP